MDMRNRTVFITGASAGIGAATARAFARVGARLLLTARREKRLEVLASELRDSFHVDVRLLVCDLREAETVTRELGALPAPWRAIDVLVNNAGLARGMEKVWEGDPVDWDEVFAVNVRALLHITRQVVPWMIARNSGHVINLGSIAGWEVYPGGAVYCASKHAVRALSRGLKMELQGTPIRVTSIDPGLVETEFSFVRFRGDSDRAKQPYVGIDPLKPEDIAEAIIWSASRPPHVNISSMVVLPTAQASSMLVHRTPGQAT